MGKPYYFGIRHLSPAGAWHLRRLLDERKPRLVLVEGPSDFSGLVNEIAGPGTKPPIAVMAFTRETPVRTILYPFAEYSPEYQAILWARENGADCRFMDLPAGVFLGMQACGEPLCREEDASGSASERVYRLLDQVSGEDDHETFWEHVMEHSFEPGSYAAGARMFGAQLRSLTQGKDRDWPEILVREAYMRRTIAAAVAEGYAPQDIVVVTGAYHVEGLEGTDREQEGTEGTDREREGDKAESAPRPEAAPELKSVPSLESLPKLECSITLMPYSYYRLSSRSGYGAGNKAPSYYGMLWQAFCEGDRDMAALRYLSRISGFQRAHGFMVSTAEVIEAVNLARSLAAIHSYQVPSLRDLQDGAVTSMGHGSFSEIALAAADTEIGSVVGSLPQGVSRTSLQDDFYRNLQELKLEKFKSDTASTLDLDLREKLSVKSEKAAFRDLNRSFFLHRLRVLGVKFANPVKSSQDNATWSEVWNIRWSPEVEIELVEAALKGDTVLQAASLVLKEQAQAATGIREASGVIRAAFYCGMPKEVEYATTGLQKLAVDSAAVEELAAAGESLSLVIRFGTIRHLDTQPLKPLIGQLFLRFCLLLSSACACDDQAAGRVMEAMERMNTLCLHHDLLDSGGWTSLQHRLGSRDDINTGLSGFSAAILLERGRMEDEELGREVHRRLSKGIPAQLGAGWFAGLSRKNRYALIARLSLWRELSDYLDTLDNEEFKRALLFLRRAFADFSPKEKFDVAENLGEIWQVGREQAAEILNRPVKEDEQELLDGLEDFDFDDI